MKAEDTVIEKSYKDCWDCACEQAEISFPLGEQQGRKEAVLMHYGGGQCVCVRCGFTDLRTLSIDHIEGGGTRERIKFSALGSQFYRRLQKNNYPDGYQTLCMNCQWIKRFENKEHRGGIQ